MSDGDPVTRIGFWDLFSALPNDGLQLRHDLIVNGQLFAANTPIAPNQLLAGVDFTRRKGFPLAIETQDDGAYILRGFYVPNN